MVNILSKINVNDGETDLGRAENEIPFVLRSRRWNHFCGVTSTKQHLEEKALWIYGLYVTPFMNYHFNFPCHLLRTVRVFLILM